MSSDKPRVLVVAPNVGLRHAADEVEEVVNALDCRLLQGTVTTVDLMRALREPYDLVWFATHAGPDGLAMSDALVGTDRLVQYLRGSQIKGVYLNTCDSLLMATDVHERLGVPVICTVSSLPDESAFVTGAQLAMHLGNGLSLREAYELSMPGGDQDYRMIGRPPNEDRIDGLIRMLSYFHSDLKSEINGVEERFNDRLDGIERDIDHKLSEIDNRYQFRLTRRNTLSWSGGFSVFSVVMALGYVDVRHMLGISWQASLIFSLPLLVLSGTLIAIGLGMTWGNDVD